MSESRESSRWAHPAVVGGLYAILSLALCSPLFTQPFALGVNDWDQHLFYYGSVLKNLIEYGQAPFWNPWYCGGNVMWQNPQIALLSPAYPLALAMPLQLAMKVNIVLHYWIGFVGAHLLISRIIGVTFLPLAVFLSTLIAAGGATALHLTAGHSVFLPGLYLPALLFFFLRALRDGGVRDLALAAGVMALMVFNGGVHILPMVVAGLGTFCIFSSAFARTWRPLLFAAIFFVAGFSLAAPKLLPVSLYVTGDTFWDTRNVTEHPDRMTWEMIEHVYLDPYQHTGLAFTLQRHRWQEYGNYIGPLSALLIPVSVMVALVRRRSYRPGWGPAFALTTVVLFLLSLGEFGSIAPASIATHLPLFSSFRIPSRYTIPYVLFGAVCVGWVAQELMASRPISRSVSRTLATICIIASLQLIVVNRHFFERVFRDAPSFDTTFSLMGGPPTLGVDRESNPYSPGSPMLGALMTNQSFFSCYESLQVKRTADSGHPLVYGDDFARVSNVTFSPNRIEFDAVAAGGVARVFLNQNFAHGWRSDAGSIMADKGTDRISVMLAPGQAGHYAFTFAPPGLWLGVGLAAVTLGAAIATRRLRLGAVAPE